MHISRGIDENVGCFLKFNSEFYHSWPGKGANKLQRSLVIELYYW